MPKETKLQLWEWVYLFIIGFVLPPYNISLNYFIGLNFKFELVFYIVFVVLITAIFSFILFFSLNLFRRKTGFTKRIDTLFILYLFSVSFGSFFINVKEVTSLFVTPFLIIYFLEMTKLLNEFPH
jgi:hypothetical protein